MCSVAGYSGLFARNFGALIPLVDQAILVESLDKNNLKLVAQKRGPAERLHVHDADAWGRMRRQAHSLNENAARPEYGLRNYESAYEADLDRVAGVLTNWSRDLRHEHSPPTLLFGLTTPMLFSAHADEVIRRHNVRLARAAQAWPGRPLHLPSAPFISLLLA